MDKEYESMSAWWDASVLAYRDCIAVELADKQYSYGEIDELASQFAAHLSVCQTKKNDIFAIYSTKTVDYVVCILAVWKISCAFIPIDVELPAERIKYMLAVGQIENVIVENSHTWMKGWNQISTDTLHRNLENKLKIGYITPSRADTAYVIFTSGSTGDPKGVNISAGSLTNFITAMRMVLPVAEGDRFLSITTVSFDISIMELFLPLCTGATLVLATKRIQVDMNQLRKTLTNKGITVMQATPVTWKMLLGSGWKNPEDMKILCGGEAMNPELAEKLLSCSSHVYNLYGPTETTIWSSVMRVKNPSDIHLGNPVLNTQFYILDENRKEADKGELYIGGAGVAKGYYGRPDLTEERFTYLPGKPRERVYRTGDMVERRNGNYYFLGRADYQLKINGYRIEPAEIEQAALRLTEVSEAVAVPDTETKILYLFIKADTEISGDKIAEFLKGALPVYMIPHHIVFTDTLPRTFNQKIDRKKLIGYYRNKQANSSDISLLTELWKQVLKREDIEADVSYIEYAPDSLSMVTLCNSMNTAGFLISFDDLIRLGSINQIYKYLEGSKIVDSVVELSESAIDFTRRFGEGEINGVPYHLSELQKAMLFDLQFYAGKFNFIESYTIVMKNRSGRAERLNDAIYQVTSMAEVLKSIYYFDKRGNNMGIYIPHLKLCKNTVKHYENDDEAKLACAALAGYGDVNKTAMISSIHAGCDNIYLNIRYHHIRLDMDTFYGLLCEMLEKAIEGDEINCLFSHEDGKYFGDNDSTIVLNEMLSEELYQFCKKRRIRLGVFLQWFIIYSFFESTGKEELVYSVVLKDWSVNSRYCGNNIRVLPVKTGKEDCRDVFSYQNQFDTSLNKCEIYNSEKNILFIVNYVQQRAKIMNHLRKYGLLEVQHSESNIFLCNIIINIDSDKIKITSYDNSGIAGKFRLYDMAEKLKTYLDLEAEGTNDTEENAQDETF